MSIFKKSLSVLLAVCMILSLFVLPASADEPEDENTVYYVDSYYGDDNNDGTTEETALLNIITAYNRAQDGDTIALADDFDLYDVVTAFASNKSITFDGNGYTLTYLGDSINTTSSGLFTITAGSVTFTNLTIDINGRSTSHTARAIYAINSEVVLEDVTITDGNHTDQSMGGGAVYIDSGATVTMTGNSAMTANNSQFVGGAVYVADGGTFVMEADSIIDENSAPSGAAIYVAANGTVILQDNATITENTASNAGAGIFVAQGASVTVSDEVVVSGNTVSSKANNVYLQSIDADVVTNDTSKIGVLTVIGDVDGAEIGITCQTPNYYRLVGIDGSISAVDEDGFFYDDGTYDIREMTYDGVHGLYLYYFTIPIEYENIEGVEDITGDDIDGTTISYPDEFPIGSDDDYVLDVTADDDYRVPEEVIVKAVDEDGNERELVEGEDYDWVPDYDDNTGKIVIHPDVAEELQENGEYLVVTVTADKYYDVTLKLTGVDVDVYDYYDTDDDTTDPADADVVENGYSVVLDDESSPLSGTIINTEDNSVPEDGEVHVYLYESGVSEPIASTTTTDGKFDFSGETLNSMSSYYIVVSYDIEFRTITNGYIYIDITAYDGTTVPKTLSMTSLDPELDTSEWSYVYSNDGTTATLIIPRDSIKADITIVIATNIISHTVYFDPNGGSCETTEKEIIEGSSNYGELPTPTRPGYDFDGWYTDPIGGDKVTEDTPYDKTEDSTLYAHWVPDGKTPYKIQHWIELAESDNGVNVGYVAGTTETYTDADSGVTYYLYQTNSYSNGIADATMDITGLVLSEMSSEDYDWWTIDGFTFNTDISDMSVYVNADGTSVYNMYYDRNVYKVTLDDGDGDPDNDPEIDVKYGDEIGNEDLITPEDEDKTPQNPGYEFEYWEDEDGNPVDPTDPYTKTEDDTYTPHWKEKEDTVYVVHYMLQDITQDEETGRFSVVEGSYSDVSSAESYDELYGGMSVREYYFAEDGSVVACYANTGKTNSSVTLETIPAITGFNYVGFATSLETNGDADADVTLTISGNDADIDAITDVDAISANGTITEVFLYYDRVVNKVHIDDGSDDPDYDPDDDPEVPYGGDFEDVIPDPDDPDVPTKPGYDYDGVEDGDGDPVDPTDPTDPYTEEDGDIEFDVIWTPRVYEITYVIDADSSFVAGEGGTASKVPTVQYGYRDGRTVTYDEQMGDMPTATKSGYTFVGWFIDPDDMSTMVTSSTYVTIDTVIIENETNEYEDTRPLYAVWTPNAYIVSFESGTSLKGVDATKCNPITVYMGQEYGELPVPVLEGYTFAGWYTDPNDLSTLVQATDTHNVPQNIVLYAVWTPNNYRYDFVLNDVEYGNGSTKAILVYDGITYDSLTSVETYDSPYNVNVFDVIASRVGYTFDGWALTIDGDVLSEEDIVGIEEDTTLYAQWTPKSYDLIFEIYGNIDVSNIELPEGTETQVVIENALTFDGEYSFGEFTDDVTIPETPGYQFKYWYILDENGDKVILTEEELEEIRTYTTDDDYTVYGEWVAVIVIDPDDNPFTDDSEDPFTPGSTDPVEVPADELPDELPSVDPGYEYTHDGWQDEDGNPVDPEQLIEDNTPAVITPILYPNVIFDAGTNGGTVNGENIYAIAAKDLTAGSIPTAKRSGYTFKGWYTTPSSTDGVKLTTADIETINATEEPITYYARFSSSGGDGGGGSSTTYYTITTSTDSGATVDPLGTKSVASGGTQVVTISVKDGYVISKVLVDGVNVGSVSSYTFSNVTASHTLEVTTSKGHNIDVLTEEHIAYIYGYAEDGLAHPERNLTRGQFAAIIYRLLKPEVREEYLATSVTFDDVASNAWYAIEVETLRNAGLIEGTGNNMFEPERSITRAEMVAMICRFLEIGEADDYGFLDISGHWCEDLINFAASKGWVLGYADGMFLPDNAITRAEAITIMNRVMERDNIDSSTLIQDGMIRFGDNMDKSTWYYYAIQEAANGHEFMKDSDSGHETWTTLQNS